MLMLNMSLSLENQSVSSGVGVDVKGAGAADGKAAGNPFGQLLRLVQGEEGKNLPPAAVAERLGISLEQLQQMLAEIGQEVAQLSKAAPAHHADLIVNAAPAIDANSTDELSAPTDVAPDVSSKAQPAENTALSAEDAAPPAEDAEAFLQWLANQQQSLVITGVEANAAIAALAGQEQPEPLFDETSRAQIAAVVSSAEQRAGNPQATANAQTTVEPQAADKTAPLQNLVASTEVDAVVSDKVQPESAAPQRLEQSTEQRAAAAPKSEPLAAAKGSPADNSKAGATVNSEAGKVGAEHKAAVVLDAHSAATETATETAAKTTEQAPPASAATTAAGNNGAVPLAATNQPSSNEPSERSPATPLPANNGAAEILDADVTSAAAKNTATAATDVTQEQPVASTRQAEVTALRQADATVMRQAETAAVRPEIATARQVETTAPRQVETTEDPTADLAKSEPQVSEPRQPRTAGQGGDRSFSDSQRGQQWQSLWQQQPVVADVESGRDAGAEPLVGTASSLTAADQRVLASLQPRQSEPQHSPLLRNFGADPAAALGNQLQLLVARNLDQITVRLDPQELGSMTIQLRMSEQQVNVQFQVANPHTRELVEQAMPRLREMLGDAGIQLGNTQVGQQQQRDTQQLAGDGQPGQGHGAQGEGRLAGDEEQLTDNLRQRVLHSLQEAPGRLDFYV